MSTLNYLQVVEETFFDLIDPKNGTIADTLRLIKEHNIADWGSGVCMILYIKLYNS